ncbi:hypothetical protein EDB80DRAFT_833045 [Ilyonectria destructans]|nr:hypothetical protein EDB80DRAFT_833045 [Ilyonectria destructans]
MYYTLNFWLYQDIQKDPSDQFSWLVGELDAAEKAGERVYIVGHMPMGYPDALYDGCNYSDQIVNRYKDTIKAMFFGHTHLDHFQISYTDYKSRHHDNGIATSYIAPSMTPLSGMPAFRFYTVHPTTSSKYWERRTRGWNVPACGNDCRVREVCQLRAAKSEDNCFVPVPGGGLGVRSENSPGLKATKCDHSIMMETLEIISARKAVIQCLEDLVTEERMRRVQQGRFLQPATFQLT